MHDCKAQELHSKEGKEFKTVPANMATQTLVSKRTAHSAGFLRVPMKDLRKRVLYCTHHLEQDYLSDSERTVWNLSRILEGDHVASQAYGKLVKHEQGPYSWIHQVMHEQLT